MYERLAKLAAGLVAPSVIAAKPGEETIEVSVPASTAAALYEKVRNTLDYQEEHLLRRNAIHRILKRFRGSGEAADDMASGLLKELVWAKYLPNKTVPVVLAQKLTEILRKYEQLFAAAERSPEVRERLSMWLMDAEATEIEYTLAPPISDEALASFMYEEMRSRIDWDPRLQAQPDERDLRLYIAIHKTLLKSNIPTLRFRVLTLYYPEWAGTEAPAALIEQIAATLPNVVATIEREIEPVFFVCCVTPLSKARQSQQNY